MQKVIINKLVTSMEEQYEEITAKQFGIAARSKKEAYTIITCQGDYYLPPIQSTRADFIADVLTGEKKVTKLNLICIVFKSKRSKSEGCSTYFWVEKERHHRFCKGTLQY